MNYLYHKMWDEIPYPFPNINGVKREIYKLRYIIIKLLQNHRLNQTSKIVDSEFVHSLRVSMLPSCNFSDV